MAMQKLSLRLAILSFFILGHAALAIQTKANPLAQVISLLEDLSAKVTKDGEAEAKSYAKYYDWCDDTTKEKSFEIKTATAQKDKLQAKIEKLTGSIEVSNSKIEELATSLKEGEAQLKNATSIRKSEASTYGESEQELLEVIDTLGRAIVVLQKQSQASPGALTQIAKDGLASLLPALGNVVDAAAFSAEDKQKLVALVQGSESTEDNDSELGAPSADAYESHSEGIFGVLEDLKEKAETQLSDLRKTESDAKHTYSMLKQSLEDEMAASTADLSEEKKDKAAAEEGKSSAEGDLEVTLADLKSTEEALELTKRDCMQVAADHDATVAARKEELKVISEAMKVLESTTAGARDHTYSLLQVAAGVRTSVEASSSKHPQVLTMVKRLAKEHHSVALAQLASRIAALMRLGAADSADPFAKVKDLIEGLIEKLQAEAGEEATEKAFCDEELSKTEAKTSELNAQVSKLMSKIDLGAARSAELKEQVKEMQSELAAMTEEQATMDKMRQEEHVDYVAAKEDLEAGLGGVRKALLILRDYYAKKSEAEDASLLQDGTTISDIMKQPEKPEKHAAAGGSGTSIIGILEVVESDFADDLAKVETQEATAVETYEKFTQENKVTQASKNGDVKYKTKEFTSLDKDISQLSSDRDTLNSELDAVLEYDKTLKERCIAKPETYEERKTRRTAEIKGLKEALAILEEDAALVQRSSRHRNGHRMRGSMMRVL